MKLQRHTSIMFFKTLDSQRLQADVADTYHWLFSNDKKLAYQFLMKSENADNLINIKIEKQKNTMSKRVNKKETNYLLKTDKSIKKKKRFNFKFLTNRFNFTPENDDKKRNS